MGMKKFFYRVKSGDTIFRLSKRFNVPLSTLIGDNALKKEISEGDVILISPQEPVYVVSPMQSYLDVAHSTNRTVEQLKELNPNIPYIFYGVVIKI